MRRFACVIAMCAATVALPVRVLSAVSFAAAPVTPSPSPSASPSPLPTVTPPPLFPGSLPDPLQSASPIPTRSPAPAPTVSSSVSPVPPAVVPLPTPSPRIKLPDFPPFPVASATPAAIATPVAHRPALRSEDGDRAYDLVGGKWTCRTFSGTPISHTFSRDEDALSLIVTTVFAVGDRTAKLHERYRFHAYSGRWSVSLANGQFIAVADQWTSTDWKFSGIDSEGGNAVQATMVFRRISADSYSRTFTTFDAQGKAVKSGELCLRVGD